MFGEWLDVVSLLELSVCHYIWTSFMSIFFIYVEFQTTAMMVYRIMRDGAALPVFLMLL